MARGNPVDLGHRSFRTQKEAREYFRGEIAKRVVGAVITSDEEFFQDVRALIERHSERDQKVGVGIDAFIVKLDETKNKMLWLRRTDGSSTDFSYLKCISGRGMTLYSEFTKAARVAIRPDIDECRDAYFRQHGNSDCQAPCEQTGELMAVGDCHVDHFPISIKDLVDQFLEQTGIIPSRAILSAPADRQTFTSFTCEKTAAHFVQYHRENAKLMVVHKQVNLTRKRK